MSCVKVETCRDLRTTSTKIVGFHGHFLYLSPNDKKSLTVYAVHSLIPKLQQKIFTVAFEVADIQEYALSPDGQFIFCFAVGFIESEFCQPVFFKISTTDQTYNVYTLNEQYFDEFEAVFINNMAIKCGSTDVYLYDKTLIRGEIPFWKIYLRDDRTFDMVRNNIPNPPDIYTCTRFLVMNNPDVREIMKTTTSEVLLIFDDVEWVPYLPDEHNELDLNTITCKGVHESYGRNGQRVTAVETNLTIVCHSNVYIFKLSQNRQHIFYTLKLDKMQKSYSLTRKVQFWQPKDAFFYRLANTNKKIAFVARQSISFFFIDPPELKELSFWKIQQMLGSQCAETGSWSGGVNDDEIKDLYHMNMKKSLI